MPSEKRTSTYDLGLSGKLAKKVSGMDLQSALDSVATLSLNLSMNAQEASELSAKDYPADITFQWDGRTLFKGPLVGVTHLDAHRTQLIYQDALQKARKVQENLFFKQQSLQECLDKTVARAGLSARYVGSFSDSVPAINLTGASLFDHLTELSNEFGFYFFVKPPSDQVTFLRVGSFVKDSTLQGKKQIAKLEHTGHAAHHVTQAKFRYFDPETLEPKDKQLNGADLYSSLSSFKDHSGFRDKSSWASAKGSYEAQVNENFHFEAGESLVKNQLSKKLMEQESVKIRLFEPIAPPGDRLSISNTHFSNTEGAYLVRSCRVTLTSTTPAMELEGIRP